MPIESERVRRQRERPFETWQMNWIGYDSATNPALPGAARPMEANLSMYPYAEMPMREPDWLDPAGFRYRITARELGGDGSGGRT